MYRSLQVIWFNAILPALACFLIAGCGEPIASTAVLPPTQIPFEHGIQIKQFSELQLQWITKDIQPPKFTTSTRNELVQREVRIPIDGVLPEGFYVPLAALPDRRVAWFSNTATVVVKGAKLWITERPWPKINPATGQYVQDPQYTHAIGAVRAIQCLADGSQVLGDDGIWLKHDNQWKRITLASLVPGFNGISAQRTGDTIGQFHIDGDRILYFYVRR